MEERSHILHLQSIVMKMSHKQICWKWGAFHEPIYPPPPHILPKASTWGSTDKPTTFWILTLAVNLRNYVNYNEHISACRYQSISYPLLLVHLVRFLRHAFTDVILWTPFQFLTCLPTHPLFATAGEHPKNFFGRISPAPCATRLERDLTGIRNQGGYDSITVKDPTDNDDCQLVRMTSPSICGAYKKQTTVQWNN